MKNILLALELKSSDKKLIDQAFQLADKFKAKVWVVHIAAPEPDFVGYDVGPQYIREQRAETLKKEHKQLQEIMKDFEKKGVLSDALLILGPTLESLENEVKKLNVDMLVMGSHKRGFLYELFIGHTSVHMIKNLNIPILIVPVDEEG